MAKLKDLELETGLETGLKEPMSPPTALDGGATPAAAAAAADGPSEPAAPSLTLDIPLVDLTQRVDEINQLREARAVPDPNRMTATKRRDAEFHKAAQDRIDAVRASRLVHQTPEPIREFPAIPPGIMNRTIEEMEAGRKMNRHHAGIVADRPLPNRAEVQAAGFNTPVFRSPDGAGTKEQRPASLRG